MQLSEWSHNEDLTLQSCRTSHQSLGQVVFRLLLLFFICAVLRFNAAVQPLAQTSCWAVLFSTPPVSSHSSSFAKYFYNFFNLFEQHDSSLLGRDLTRPWQVPPSSCSVHSLLTPSWISPSSGVDWTISHHLKGVVGGKLYYFGLLSRKAQRAASCHGLSKSISALWSDSHEHSTM